jgi:5'-3' exonuclease
MENLSTYLHYFVQKKINEDEGWKNIKVIISDSNVPGEGEHKIINFIKSQRNQKNYNPNTRHCICGLDADLIFLALGKKYSYSK